MIDTTKTYITKDGRPVVLAGLVPSTNAVYKQFPILGRIDTNEDLDRWDLNGVHEEGDPAYNLVLVYEQPTKTPPSQRIDLKGKYQTKSCNKVVLYAIYPDEEWPVHGAVWIPNSQTHLPVRWNMDGRVNDDTHRGWDLIPYIEPPFHKDELLVVRMYNTELYKLRYFDCYNQLGRAVCFDNGRTSKTALSNGNSAWSFAERHDPTNPNHQKLHHD